MRNLGLWLGLRWDGDSGFRPFVLSIDTTKTGAGSTANNQFKLPLTVAGSYNFSVDWGDGSKNTITTWNQAETTHTYAATGVYTVTVLGKCTHWSFNNAGDKLKVLGVSKWGNAVTTTLDFYGCTNLVSVAGTADDYPRVTSFANTFRDCTGLTIANFPALMDTSKVTNFQTAFRGCTGFVSFPSLDTSKGTNFSNTWRDCTGLTSFPSLDFSKATQIDSAWQQCTSLPSFPWINTSNLLTKADYAWSGCAAMTSFPGTPTHPTSPVTVINMSKVTNFNASWNACSGLTSFPSIDTSAGTNFSETWRSCAGLTSFPVLNTSKGTNFISAWYGCTGLAGYNFPALDMHLMNLGHTCFGTTGGLGGIAISLASYDAILNQLANGDGGSIPANTTSNTVFSGGNSKYTAAAVAGRATLTATRTWTITDGGL